MSIFNSQSIIRSASSNKNMWTSSQRFYLNAERTQVVDEKDGHFLLVGIGGEIPLEMAEKYGLLNQELSGNETNPTPKPDKEKETTDKEIKFVKKAILDPLPNKMVTDEELKNA